jgi:hypothetical protein
MKNALIATLMLAGALFLQSSGLPAQEPASGAPAASSDKNLEAALDQNVALMRQDLRSQKKQLIAANLKLTDAEATKFWPVYDQYTAELTKLGDQKYALIKQYGLGYGTLTNEQATELLKRSLALDEQIAQLRTKYVPLFNQVIPGTKTATFFQLDRRITNLIDLKVASQIPLVQEQK